MLAGGLGVACFEPFGLFWLAPGVLALLFLLWSGAATPGRAAADGFAFGLAFFLGGVSWIYVSLSVFGGMPIWLAAPATLLFCAAMGLYPALCGWAYRRWRPAGAIGQALAFAALIALTDWLRGWLGTGFPWLAWGYSQVPPSPLAGYAALLGVYGLSFLLALASALLLHRTAGLFAAGILAALGFGLGQIEWTKPFGEPVTVALFQGNVPQETKWRPEHFFATLAHYRQLVADHPARLALLPETAVPAFLDAVPPEYLAEFKQLALANDGDLLFGTVTGEPEHYQNSAVSLGRSATQVYSKSHLVPFGEFIPPGFSWFLRWADIPMSQFSRGPVDQAPLDLAGLKLAVDICYEDVFGEEIIRSVPAAGVLVNLSNTAWYGRSFAQPQHLQIARLRALETGRPILRATNTGMTAAINPDGRVAASLPAFTLGVLETRVRPYEGLTPYVRWGNYGFLALALVALAASRAIGR
ncbi:MAG: apolipoprotein N-acyltransferase [Betaproteobacteria bacterium]|jgi:apolipoprotein N-acyltransferase|nr:apolipoprotein N-acyltransferase [Betaproteobacteria bacterium]HNL20732.1 apolipoprotein N-acyltransferase [Rhodocyclaceae bacterium]